MIFKYVPLALNSLYTLITDDQHVDQDSDEEEEEEENEREQQEK